MFTGIIEDIGELVAIESRGESRRLRIRSSHFESGVSLGDSIAVNGACLTVCAIDGTEFSFDAVAETLECTALGSLSAGDRVNLERAMRADGRFDGHIVQGHVDGVGTVRALEREAEDVRLFIECAPDFADLLVDKGSVAIHGVSLTVVKVCEKEFEVALIPHTLQETTLGELGPGTPVNLEADVLGKYVKQYLSRIGVPTAGSR